MKSKVILCALIVFIIGCICTPTVITEPKLTIETENFISYDLLNSKLCPKIPTDQQYVGAIVPHHDLSLSMASEIVSTFSPTDVKTVFILGPDHSNSLPNISTTKADFSTYFGNVNPNITAIDDILSTTTAFINDGVFENEHSIGIIIPLIEYYLPDAMIVPITISKNTSTKEMDALINAIAPYLKNDSILIGSIDFSHGLNSKQSEQKTVEMVSLINQNSHNIIKDLDSRYTDSPQILSAIMRNLDLEFNIISQKTASDFDPLLKSLVTSYISILF